MTISIVENLPMNLYSNVSLHTNHKCILLEILEDCM